MCIHEAHFDLFRSFHQPLHRIRTTSWKVLWKPSTRWCFLDTDVMPSIDIPSAAHQGSPQLKCTFGGSTCIPGMTLLGGHVQDCYVENKGRSVRRTLQLFCIESASIEAQKCAFPDSLVDIVRRTRPCWTFWFASTETENKNPKWICPKEKFFHNQKLIIIFQFKRQYIGWYIPHSEDAPKSLFSLVFSVVAFASPTFCSWLGMARAWITVLAASQLEPTTELLTELD